MLKDRSTFLLALFILAAGLFLTFGGLLFFPSATVYLPLVAIGLALALQKYLASFLAYFVLRFSHLLEMGDRIRMGQLKGDIRSIGLLHFTLQEVGEDEKLGGELTGRLLHIPNLLILDQPVLNYTKDYTVGRRQVRSDYIFDEVRIPLTLQSNVDRAVGLLDQILRSEDANMLSQAQVAFKDDYPEFFQEVMSGPRVIVHIEPQHIWIKGKFVSQISTRNELRTQIYLRLLRELEQHPDIKLA